MNKNKTTLKQEFDDFDVYEITDVNNKEKSDDSDSAEQEGQLKTLNTYKTKYIIESESFIDTSIVLVYAFTENGLLEHFYLFRDYSYFTNKNFHSTLLLQLDTKKTLLSEAKSIVEPLFEKKKKSDGTEYPIEDERWVYLGKMEPDKLSNKVHNVYAFNASGLDLTKEAKEEQLIRRLPVRNAMDTSDAYILVPFLKLYRRLFLNTMRTEE